MNLGKRVFANALLALGFVSAMAITGINSANAQGFYIDVPGVHVHVGQHRYYSDRRYYDYSPGYYRDCPRGFSVQDGVCKPYRGY